MNINALDLNLLLALNALLEERSVSLAARRVGLSQPAMSHALGRLRALLDDPVLVRVGHKMVPSPRAEALAVPLRSALDTISQLLGPPGVFDPARLERTFRFASSDFLQVMVLPRLMRSLSEVAPLVDIVVPPSMDDIPGGLLRAEVDIAVGVVGAERVTAGLKSERLFDDRFVSLVRKGHALTHGKVTLERFVNAKHAFVSPRGVKGGVVDDTLTRVGMSRRVAFQSAQFLVAPYAVADADLVITLPERVANLFVAQLPLTRFAPPLELPGFTVSMIWHERNEGDPAHRFLRDLVRACTVEALPLRAATLAEQRASAKGPAPSPTKRRPSSNTQPLRS